MKEQKSPRIGSIVEIQIPNGLKIVGGKAMSELKIVRAKVYLINNGNIICAIKGREASPYAVNKYKLIKW